MEEKKKEELKKEEKKETKVKKTQEPKKEVKAKTEKTVKAKEPKKTEKKKVEKKEEPKKVEAKVEAKVEQKVEPKKEEVKVEKNVEPKPAAEVKTEVKEEAKPKFQKVEQPKKKKGSKKVIIFILLVLILGGVALAWMYIPEFRNLFNANNSNTGNAQTSNELLNAQEWEKAYVEELTGNSKYSSSIDCKIQLIAIDSEDVLLVMYTDNNKKTLDIWKFDNETKEAKLCNTSTVSDDGVKILYNISNEKYNWYTYYKDNEEETYRSISALALSSGLRVNSYREPDGNRYAISEKAGVGNTTREKFEKEIVVVDSKYLNKTWVDYRESNSKEDTLKVLKNEYKKKRTAREVVKDAGKEVVLDRVEEIQNKPQVTITEEENKQENTTTETTTNTETQATEQESQETTQVATENKIDIGKDEALKLLEKKFGTNADGKKMGYYYLAWVKDDKDNKYYAYQMSWLVNGHYSFVNTVLVSADGKSYKEIGTPEDFTDGQTVTKFDAEKSF